MKMTTEKLIRALREDAEWARATREQHLLGATKKHSGGVYETIGISCQADADRTG